MNTGPTPISAALAGTPLSNQTIASHQNTTHLSSAKPHLTDPIRDTLETTDREADGRQPLESNEQATDDNESGHRLDLTG